MPTPGVSVLSDVQRVLRGTPTDTGTLFVAGPTQAGTAGTVVKLTSIADYVALGLGTRTGTAAVVFDSIENFFAEGGATCHVSRTIVSTVDVATALSAFGKALGPGQVIAPGDTTAHAALLTHASTNNRVALLSGGGTVTIGPIAGSTANRNIPPEAAAAGLIARSDALRSTNNAPAGDRGFLRASLDVVNPATVAGVVAFATAAKGMTGADFGALFTAGRFTDTERATLDEGSVNPFIVDARGNGVQLYGFSGLPVDSFFTNARLRMSLTARFNNLAQQFVFRTINDTLRGALKAVLLAEFDKEYKAGQLFGATAADAYDVDVSDAVNTPATIAAGRLIARAWYVPGPFAERVEIYTLALPVPAAVAV
jgi:hypothetical protein